MDERAALATECARTVDRYMGNLFTTKATIYDQAMDQGYLDTHIGGGWPEAHGISCPPGLTKKSDRPHGFSWRSVFQPRPHPFR
jgi:hypothetical protein